MLPVCAAALALLTNISRAEDPSPVRLAVIGDSTVCEWPADSGQCGWGQFIHEYYEDEVAVTNLARSGRSTKTFIREGRWEKTLEIQPDVILIQFGHNDSHAPDRPESTDSATDYPEYLRRYVREAREQDAMPIFVTPMVRRQFHEDGTMRDNLRPYAEAMISVGKELDVPVIDLHQSSWEIVEELGPERSPELANAPGDGTHFNEKGARLMAELVMQELSKIDSPLQPHLKQ